MNFEKLSSKKFESFNENILDSANLVVGGKCVNTKRNGSKTWNDSLDNSTKGKGNIHSNLGNRYDYNSTVCSRVGSANNSLVQG